MVSKEALAKFMRSYVANPICYCQSYLGQTGAIHYDELISTAHSLTQIIFCFSTYLNPGSVLMVTGATNLNAGSHIQP